ncbi:hypothetical protein HETIRDRAFT_422747 [Heterobasidion irregulare TC 32-1]|uniref:DUF6534 domain-containing protein n=1 Tax=Heterobasidion irregulare (strain TC 32-1) TaxID=747525 RepID=W4JRS6_HETIT|nr:uncharacterized protein HETIRDRAFT_422747 [Heterobasidion irregulare TC 32-1]ETW76174.1 hypothetical protein HETIRDRAFT_422747 [Heterobasidion irregulare TC 32-1]
MLNRLIRFTVASGAITAFAMVIHIGLYYSAPNTNLYTLTAMTTSKLYTNSVLASLNSRRALASKTSDPFIESFAASTPTGPLVHVSRHIEFSRPNESQSIEPRDSETRDKVLAIRPSSSDFMMMDLSKNSSHV